MSECLSECRDVSLVGLHGREEKHLLDVIRICQQHSQTIDAHAPSSGGWQAIFESLDEGLINALCLVISGILGSCLLLEAFELDLWVVQLGVRVNELVLVREQLEALCQALLRAMPFGQRTHQLRMVDDEAGADALRLKELADKLVNQTGGRTGVRALDVLLDAELVEELARFLSLEVTAPGQLDSESLFESLHHFNSAERWREVDLVHLVWVIFVIPWVILNLVFTVDRHDHFRQEPLSEVHQVVIIGISPIKLAGRELRVVSQINTFIAELLADLEDTVHSTDNQHLEVELRCNSHEKFHVQVIMEGLKGPCSGSTSNHVHHWCLNFCEVLGSQEVSQEVEDFIAR